MKKVFNLLVTAFSILFALSCTPEAREINRQYQIVNFSTVDVQIKFFNTFDNTDFVIDILNGDISSGNILTYRTGNDQWFDSNGSFPRRAFNDSDSLKIIFNNSKFITFSYTSGIGNASAFSTPLNRNPFRHGNYLEVQKEIFQFIITQEDYDNAEPCIGDCLD